MVNLPDSLYEDYSQLQVSSPSYASSSSAPPPPALPVVYHPTVKMIFQWVYDLHKQNSFESDLALHNLTYHRNNIEFLPRLLWESNGTAFMMLQEITDAYRRIERPISPPFSPPFDPYRVYNFLLLFQGIAYNPETRGQFLKAKMPNYFYPLMEISLTDKPYECIRLAALGVIAHLLKNQDEAAIRFLMETAAVGYCVKPAEFGSTESKTLAVFILHKIMSTEEGLQYCCVLADRFFFIDEFLKKMLDYLCTMTRPYPMLLNLIVGCYSKLSQKPRVCEGLRRFPPALLFDGTFARLIAEDPSTENYWRQLVQNLGNISNEEPPERLFSMMRIC